MYRNKKLKEKSHDMRRKGFSHVEIARTLKVPRSTVVSWNKFLALSVHERKHIEKNTQILLALARQHAADSHRVDKLRRKESAASRVTNLHKRLSDLSTRKLVLGALYLAEGSKGDRSGITFANSDPEIIKLFLLLLREGFMLDESKFRCTIQARESQNISGLERYWSQLTKIPSRQFYTARIDPRSHGKKTLKTEYKGVCRIDYLSTDLLYEVLAIGTMLVRTC